ncbi:MAG: aminotransferase class I/II-fold pyridoxal phosphate-dependent enzyme [Phycisphaeraceae bacterium]|nr:MAG: aminotransferase class I/II-fold pyridoxal phosphate-dependent enzyme [Phycisphaeraceae bacterium]
MTTGTAEAFANRARGILSGLEARGELKHLQVIDGPMDATVRLRAEDGKFHEALCFCSNNYLGLANHPEVVEAGIAGLKKYGAGTASVRFICGTFTPHLELEERIARFLGVESAYTFVSCWNASEAVFPTLAEPGDAIVSDALNHACIIDSIRLAGVIKKGVQKFIYPNNDLGALEEKLGEARAKVDDEHVIWVVTDGVFSMEGSVADLPAMRRLCDAHGAILVVDDSHGTGVLGKTGRGTHEHHGMAGNAIDLFTGTLGKALGGGAGGYIAGPRHATELVVQRGRPTLFSNALPVTVACSASKAIEIIDREPERVARLRENVAYARKKIRAAGFEVLESPTAICPVIVGETAKAISMSKRLLELGVYVIGFGFPVVPEGEARLRCQISAAHTREHIDALADGLARL